LFSGEASYVSEVQIRRDENSPVFRSARIHGIVGRAGQPGVLDMDYFMAKLTQCLGQQGW